MLGDPLGVYRLPRESQVVVLGYLEHVEYPHGRPTGTQSEIEAAAIASGFLRIDAPRQPAPVSADPWLADPERGRRLPRERGVVAVNKDARERADRFRAA
jgi:hypothetical protein